MYTSFVCTNYPLHIHHEKYLPCLIFVLAKIPFHSKVLIILFIAKYSGRLKKRKTRHKEDPVAHSRSQTKSKKKYLRPDSNNRTYDFECRSVAKPKKQTKPKKLKKRHAKTNHNLKAEIGPMKKAHHETKQRFAQRPSKLEKIYKEDSEEGHASAFQANLHKKICTEPNLDFTKHKSVDDRRRSKLMKRLKSLTLKDKHMLVDENYMPSNVPPGAGRKLDTIYNKTLSILCHTP